MLSFWEKQSFLEYDYIIAGGGITGLSTAVSIKEKAPKARVLVLERGVFPSGASTKNAGFACFGSLTELLADVEKIGPDQTLELVTERWEGLKKLRSRLGDAAIDYQGHGGYELVRKDEIAALDRLEEVNDLLMPLFYQPVFVERKDLRKSFGFPKSHVNTMLANSFEGQLDTGKMMRRLIAYAGELGVMILTGAFVQNINESTDQVELHVLNQATGSGITFSSEKVALCTNAFINDLVPGLNVAPGRGVVIVTKPVKNLPFKGVFHFDEGYFYFRNYKDRIIFGGGRNLDPEGEKDTRFLVNEKILKILTIQLKEMILPSEKAEIDYAWAGIMGFGSDKKPLVKKHTERIFLGVKLGGMGVSIGSRIGEKLSKMMLKTT